ncbi:MAG: HpcH/HpaI aldolase/citrate lyase family protein [Roseburia sp.]|nr:HpcH/HpaI aldolase/citrate lyase family protein [Roseburia sp.]
MLELMYITNNPEVAKIVDEAGVERVWIDLETLGKEKRQKGYDTVKSHHCLNDIKVIKPLLKRAELQVRINPINNKSKEEIERVIEYGADIIMLPYYKTVDEVQLFSEFVSGRTKTVLLLETREAHKCLDETLMVPGIDEIHIGLNDLHLSYGRRFMFELLAEGMVESICKKISVAGKPYGFGGIAKLDGGLLPAKRIIAEHFRLGSTRAILSRSFCNVDDCKDLFEVEEIFNVELKKLRDYELSLKEKDEMFFLNNHQEVVEVVAKIIDQMSRKD